MYNLLLGKWYFLYQGLNNEPNINSKSNSLESNSSVIVTRTEPISATTFLDIKGFL